MESAQDHRRKSSRRQEADNDNDDDYYNNDDDKYLFDIMRNELVPTGLPFEQMIEPAREGTLSKFFDQDGTTTQELVEEF